MKLKLIISSFFATMLAGLLLAGCATSQDKLAAHAKIPRADAEKIALGKVPGGTIKEGEIEKEKGKVVWSFDISQPGTTDITEVQVDAMTGDIVSVEKETPAEQEKEKK